MARSRKKIYTSTDHCGYAKTEASRISRRKISNVDYDISSGNSYKKLYESWNIHDWRCAFFTEAAWQFEQNHPVYKDRPWFKPHRQWKWKGK